MILLCHRISFWHLICGLVVNDASATALLKGEMFLLVLVETGFFRCSIGSIRRSSGQVSSYAGESKGGSPPLCRCGGGVHRGGTPSKGSLPYAAFWLLFVRTKSNPGFGGGAPARFQEETCFIPTRPAIRESQRIGAIRWHRRSETGRGG